MNIIKKYVQWISSLCSKSYGTHRQRRLLPIIIHEPPPHPSNMLQTLTAATTTSLTPRTQTVFVVTKWCQAVKLEFLRRPWYIFLCREVTSKWNNLTTCHSYLQRINYHITKPYLWFQTINHNSSLGVARRFLQKATIDHTGKVVNITVVFDWYGTCRGTCSRKYFDVCIYEEGRSQNLSREAKKKLYNNNQPINKRKSPSIS